MARKKRSTSERRQLQAALHTEVYRKLQELGIKCDVGVVSVMRAGYRACGRELKRPYHGKSRNVRQLQNILRWLDKGVSNPVPHEASSEFLKSYEWRKVRYQALKRSKGRCECCGARPEDGIKLNVDHIKPRKKHPELALALSNLQVLCGACNHGKGNWDETDWREPSLKTLMGEGIE